MPAAGQDQTAAANSTSQQDVTVPPIAANPTQGQGSGCAAGQQRIEVQGDLNNALTQQQGQLDGAVANSTLPTEPGYRRANPEWRQWHRGAAPVDRASDSSDPASG